jgi:hypothetical protein
MATHPQFTRKIWRIAAMESQYGACGDAHEEKHNARSFYKLIRPFNRRKDYHIKYFPIFIRSIYLGAILPLATLDGPVSKCKIRPAEEKKT